MSDTLSLLLLIAAAAGVLFAIERGLRRRARRWESDDWRDRAPSVRVGTPLLEIQSLFEPRVKSALEEQRREHREERDAGAPPEAREPGADS